MHSVDWNIFYSTISNDTCCKIRSVIDRGRSKRPEVSVLSVADIAHLCVRIFSTSYYVGTNYLVERASYEITSTHFCRYEKFRYPSFISRNNKKSRCLVQQARIYFVQAQAFRDFLARTRAIVSNRSKQKTYLWQLATP